MNTQILEISLSMASGILAVVLCYLVSKTILHLILKKTRDELDMLYDMLDERDDELERYHRMFGPLKDWEDWEDSEWAEKSKENLIDEHSVYIEDTMGPDENDELPF